MHTKDPLRNMNKPTLTQRINQSEHKERLGLKIILNFVEKYLMNKTLQESDDGIFARKNSNDLINLIRD